MKLAFLTSQQLQFSDQRLWVLGSVALMGIGMLQAVPTAEWEAMRWELGLSAPPVSRLLDRTPLAWLTVLMGVLKTLFWIHQQFIYAANTDPNICWGQWIHSQRNSSGKMNRTCSNKENVTFRWLPCHFFIFFSCFVVVSSKLCLTELPTYSIAIQTFISFIYTETILTAKSSIYSVK